MTISPFCRPTKGAARRSSGRNSSAAAVFAALLLAVPLHTAVAESAGLVAGKGLEDAGRAEEALAAYLRVVDEGCESGDMAEAAYRAARLSSSLSERAALLRRALACEPEARLRHAALVALAEAEAAAGNLSAAQSYFLSASFAEPSRKDFRSLLESALLLFELGDYRNSESQVRALIDTCKEPALVLDATVLLSRIQYATDRDRQALETLHESGVASGATATPAGLLWLYEIAGKLDRPDMRSGALVQLEKRFPESLERGLAVGAVEHAVSPSLFFGVGRGPAPTDVVEPTTPAPAPVDTRPSSSVISIQTGSFSVRENADYAAKDLRASGFNAAIVERVVAGKTFHRVVVPDVPANEVQQTLILLKDKGFEGFPLYD